MASSRLEDLERECLPKNQREFPSFRVRLFVREMGFRERGPEQEAVNGLLSLVMASLEWWEFEGAETKTLMKLGSVLLACLVRA